MKWSLAVVVIVLCTASNAEMTKFDMVTKFLDLNRISQEMKSVSDTINELIKDILYGLDCNKLFCDYGGCSENAKMTSQENSQRFWVCVMGHDNRQLILSMLIDLNAFLDYNWQNFREFVAATLPKTSYISVLNFPEFDSKLDEQYAKVELERELQLLNSQTNESEIEDIVSKWQRLTFGEAQDITPVLPMANQMTPASNFTPVSNYESQEDQRAFDIMSSILANFHVKVNYLSTISQDISTSITQTNIKKLRRSHVPTLILDKEALEKSKNLLLLDMKIELNVGGFTNGEVGLARSITKCGNYGIHIMIRNGHKKQNNTNKVPEFKRPFSGSSLDEENSGFEDYMQTIIQTPMWELCQMGGLILAFLHTIIKTCISYRLHNYNAEYDE